MEDKYYTPEIEEFHIGFEYEYNCNSDIFGRNWKNNILSLEDLKQDYDGGYEYSNPFCEYSSFRVKYIDQKDIESLGWIRREEWESDGEQRYFRTDIDSAYELRIWETYISIKTTPVEFYEADGPAWQYIITSINIKNKSELIKLTKQVDLWKNVTIVE